MVVVLKYSRVLHLFSMKKSHEHVDVVLNGACAKIDAIYRLWSNFGDPTWRFMDLRSQFIIIFSSDRSSYSDSGLLYIRAHTLL